MKGKTSASSQRVYITRISLISLFGALIAAGTFISIPIPGTPITIVLQNMYALLAGLILGPVNGALSSALYLIVGILGAPVFPRGNGGIVYLQGPSGGYLAAYPLMAFVAGLIAGRPKYKVPFWRLLIASVAGMLVVYVPGVAWLKVVLDDTWQGAIVKGFLPFIVFDMIKAVFATLIAMPLRRTVINHLDV